MHLVLWMDSMGPKTQIVGITSETFLGRIFNYYKSTQNKHTQLSTFYKNQYQILEQIGFGLWIPNSPIFYIFMDLHFLVAILESFYKEIRKYLHIRLRISYLKFCVCLYFQYLQILEQKRHFTKMVFC